MMHLVKQVEVFLSLKEYNLSQYSAILSFTVLLVRAMLELALKQKAKPVFAGQVSAS